MNNKLKALISSLEPMNSGSEKITDLDNIITILHKIEANSPLEDENRVASRALSIFSILSDKITRHPKKHAFIQFCKQLNPSHIELSDVVHERLFNKQTHDQVKSYHHRRGK